MLEIIGCILLSIISITFIVMLIDELRTNYKMRKWYKENNKEWLNDRWRTTRKVVKCIW